MLDGRYGKGKALAMRVQKTIGEGFRAQRMVPITRAHVALSAQEADTWFARKLRDAGAQCAVPPTVNPGYCLKYFQQMGCVDEKSSALMRETHQVYQDLGAILTYSCTPYLFGNIPRYGETVSFSETSVTVYANSVLGARTNRESSASALCAAITGFVPNAGCSWTKTGWERSWCRWTHPFRGVRLCPAGHECKAHRPGGARLCGD